MVQGEGQGLGADLGVELLEGEEVGLQVDGRVDRGGLGAPGKAAEALHLGGVVGRDLPAGAGDAQAVEELEEIAADRGDEVARLPLLGRALGPGGEVGLGLGDGALDRRDAEAGLERGVGGGVVDDVGAGDEGDLVAQIGELVVDGRGGEQQHLRADAAGDDVLHEPLVARPARGVLAGARSRLGVVAEVVGFVDHDEVVGAPVEGCEVDPVRVPAVPREIGVVEHVVAKAVFLEGVERAVLAIDEPVFGELLGAEDEDALVFQLEVFDDGEGLEGFAETDAVGEDAAVVGEYLVDRRLGAVFLKGVEGVPDPGVGEGESAQGVVDVAGAVQRIAEQVEERQVVDELRRMVAVEFGEVVEDLLLDVLDEALVVPDLSEPSFQILPVAGAVDDQVEFEVVVAGAEPQPGDGEVGAAQDGLLDPVVVDVVELAMEQIGLADRPDVGLACDPLGALARDSLLLKAVGERQASVVDLERLAVHFLRIHAVDERGLAKEEVHVGDTVQYVLQGFVGIDREVGGNHGKGGSGPHSFTEIPGHASMIPVVTNPGRAQRMVCLHDVRLNLLATRRMR